MSMDEWEQVGRGNRANGRAANADVAPQGVCSRVTTWRSSPFVALWRVAVPVAVVGAVSLVTPRVAVGAQPSAAAAPDQSPEADDTASEGSDEGGVALQALRQGAAARLEGPARTAFDQMSDDDLATLMNSAQDAKLSEEQSLIREAVGKEAFESTLSYQTGDITIGDGLATLHLGEGFRYLDPKDSEKLLVEGWGNPPGSDTLGMIVPRGSSPLHDTEGWAVVVSYSEEGHVEDDDAEDIDYDDLIEEMRADTAEDSKQRVAQGYGSIELVGWAAPPHYDSGTHRLYWAKELAFGDSKEHTLNYAIRVLGRKGVLELNAVAGMTQLGMVQKEMEKVLPLAEFETGSRYADFDPELDAVAAYGIGGLIAGKALMKAGFFAGLLKILIASKKLILVAVAALGAGAAKLFKRDAS